jgi:hypothetical protein
VEIAKMTHFHWFTLPHQKILEHSEMGDPLADIEKIVTLVASLGFIHFEDPFHGEFTMIIYDCSMMEGPSP